MTSLQQSVELLPDVGDQRRQLRSFSRKLTELPRDLNLARDRIEKLRASIGDQSTPRTTDTLRFHFVCNVLLDLALQGWTLEVADQIVLRERSLDPESQLDSKQRIRNQHLAERNAQLREQSVAEFIQSMERRRLTEKGWHSIFSVMRDGEELASSLREAKAEADPGKRLSALARAIDPYIEFVDSDAVCSETGLRLNDIWRYFRHSWTTVYKSVPGRSMGILIRDRARPNHPVIGIAALGSSVVQSSVRDRWIGWDKESVNHLFCDAPTKRNVRRLLQVLDGMIKEVYKTDLFEEGIITRWSVRKPALSDLERLQKASLTAIKSHRLYPNLSLKNSSSDQARQWRRSAQTSLFKSKRCKHLATLLGIRYEFGRYQLGAASVVELRQAMKQPSLRRALGQLLRLMKAERVGINMMDITVCGAVAPYNPILGGKLVCMMLASPEVVREYRDRYRRQVSIIASSMAGKEIRRDPQLVLLATTSLYEVGSSQYNRIKVPAHLVGGAKSATVAYIELGKSEGFGSFQFSKETVRVAHALLGRLEGGRKVNSIFGEGVNPLMRKMREALNAVNLPSEVILRHGNRRIVFAVPLAKNFREVLMGMDRRPVYLLPKNDPENVTRALADYWRRRWLEKRIENDSVLLHVARNTLSYPIEHGARVPLESDDADQLLLWQAV